MHEMSIVESLIRLSEENLKNSGGSKIKEIHIKVGRLSGVESYYLKSCYDIFREGTACEGAELIINEQDIVVECEACEFSGNLSENHFICPKCGSQNLKVIDGEDMYLMRLVIE